MRLTYDLLVKHDACIMQRDAFRVIYPNGCEPTVETLTLLAAEGLDSWWLWNVLPDDGPGSKRAYALWCAEEVAHLNTDPRVAQCLAVVRRRVEHPEAVSQEEMAAAWAAAWDAATSAAWAAAWDAARDAAWDAARDAAWAAARAAERKWQIKRLLAYATGKIKLPKLEVRP